jgi:hypothetical protein
MKRKLKQSNSAPMQKFNEVPSKVLLPVWARSESKARDYIKRYKNYELIKFESPFAICRRDD